jgi:transposase
LRQALHDAGVVVHRVSPKVAHDYAEVFDGVPSQHDGKDAAVVAELSALGKSVSWPFVRRAEDQEMAYWVDRLDQQRGWLAMCYGRLEGLLARHWPESMRLLPVSSGVLLRCLERYGSPAEVAADGEALGRLRRWGGPLLSEAKAQALRSAAATSVGVRAEEFDLRRLQEQAVQARQARRELGVCKRRLAELQVGDPREYGCGAAYRKAMGFNLTERSSGRWQGGLHISRRGPGEARRWLYYAALRLVRRAGVREWYEAKKARDGGRAGRALIGVARKLAVALYHVGTSGEAFDAGRLFAGSEK